MIALHWDEVERDKNSVALDVDWVSYRRAEKDGQFRAIEMTKKGQLIGYNGFFVHHSWHFKGLMTAICDVVYVTPEARGAAGVKLLKDSEKLIATLAPMVKIFYHSKPYVHIGAKSGTLGQLLGHLGYRHDEDVLTKIVRAR